MADRADPEPIRDKAMFALAGSMALVVILAAAADVSARLAGHRLRHSDPLPALEAFAHFGDPSLAWHAPVGSPLLYWTLTFGLLALVGFVGLGCRRVFGSSHSRLRLAADDPDSIEGLATRRQVLTAAGDRALRRRATTLRPSLRRPRATDVGFRLGYSRGVGCWVSVEDSITVLGPPRSGKGYHIVIPAILDYPGPVVTTSTRPDNLEVTMTDRARLGPVAVFDPERLAAGAPSVLRWDPARGCDEAETAMVRAGVLCANQDYSAVKDGSYWQQQTMLGVRCLLHAAAVSGRGAASLYEWSLSAPHAKEALQILRNTPAAIPLWATGLDSIISSDPKHRDDIWSMVTNAFSALADPKVLAAVSPSPGERFDPLSFLRDKGTLYLLGSAGTKEHTGTSTLVAAMIEDIVHTARHLAAASPGARLDPPLGLILDEAANYPLPSLPGLISEGGGTGITTMAVLQSLAQARERWGRDEAQAIWDSSIVKVILGGGSNADDLTDISKMLGERTVRQRSKTRPAGGGTSWSESDRQEPIMEPAMMRTLIFGRALLLLRSAPPIMLSLQPWSGRPDAGNLQAHKAQIEAAIQETASAELEKRRLRET